MKNPYLNAFDRFKNTNIESMKENPIEAFIHNSYTMQKKTAFVLMEELREAENGGDDEQMTQINFLLSMIETNLPAAEKRVSHTLRRIKEKGRYKDSILKILEQESSKSDDSWYAKRMFLLSIYEDCSVLSQEEVALCDEDWYRGIELSMLIHCPEKVFDLSITTYAPFIDDYIDEMIICTAFIHFLTEIEVRGRLNGDIITITKENEKLEKLCAQLQCQVEQANSTKPQDERILILENELKIINQKHEKEIVAAKHENSDLLKKKDDEIKRLQEELAHLKEQNSSELSKPECQEEQYELPSIELPQKNVLFLGGHPNLLNKLSDAHPEWIFVNDDDYRKNIRKNIDVVFFWTGHMSHKLNELVFSQISDDAKIVYVTATNVDRLEAEMKAGYAKVITTQAA